ncbi:glycosyltransferase family 2 protein [Noviherbaspirillum sedimenti]|uniref:Glycosyltransferase family 2 protein n=1 Tax=Noviherbaspirillum sedimenti TaxID=2320865 RepID=A0A3A3G0M9_9BURK|nr:glycosyltransferase family 2 protein [Noviherbaspirillum sedimenti]RJG02018.1 glycosyltransferase family 2 protein [Noviherbaspirillum sedimenti]
MNQPLPGQPEKNAASPKLTIGILTLNEEKRIANCIASAKFADQIIVVDSGSKDRTCEIAAALGAEVHAYPQWQGFAVQRNRVLQHAKGDYIFFLDADEEIPPALQQEIAAVVAAGKDEIWEVQWNQVAFGRPLTLMKSTGGIQRMFRTGSIREFTGLVHEHADMHGDSRAVHLFRARLLHYSRESIYSSLNKLAQYVQLGAAKRAQAGKKGGVLRGMASALAIFLKLYVFRRGFLCGAAGFLFCFFIALECFFRHTAIKYDAGRLEQAAMRG